MAVANGQRIEVRGLVGEVVDVIEGSVEDCQSPNRKWVKMVPAVRGPMPPATYQRGTFQPGAKFAVVTIRLED